MSTVIFIWEMLIHSNLCNFFTDKRRGEFHSPPQERNRFISCKFYYELLIYFWGILIYTYIWWTSYVIATESGILCTPGVLSSSRYERFSSDQGKTSSQYQNSTINSRRSNYETTVIEPKRLFGIDDVNSGEGILFGRTLNL